MALTSVKKSEIILVDDNPIDLQVCKMVFKQTQPDIDFKIFDNGFTAVQWVAENTENILTEEKNIILLDLNMPVMDGWGFLNYFEKFSDEIKQKVSIYILTSSIDESDIERSKKYSSVKNFYSKPLTNKIIRTILETEN